MRLALLLCTLSAALCLASAVGQSAGQPTKSSAGGYPKKVTTLKKRPTKTPSTAATSATGAQTTTTTKPSKPRVKIATTSKTATTKTPALDAKFSNLPADDLEFIKELDKQFKLHGNKIKIKVERDNSTNGSGNGKKRTIDGELGYGYAHQGYDYTPPKFMFYPYSQHDIPATESPDAYAYSPADYEQPETTQPHQAHQQQQQQVTSVTIEPSYSYELKPQTSYEAQQPVAVEQHAQPEQPQIDLPQPQHEAAAVGGGVGVDETAGYQEPVIVLRIPGPAKYAAHLQTLLQQYLEIRAAQYLQLLQDAEQRKHQQHQAVELQPQQSYAPVEQQEQAHYHPEVAYAHQLAPTPPPVQYGAIDDVYQTYKGRQQLQQQPQYEQPAPEAYYAPTGYPGQPTQFYYAQPQAQPQYESSYQPQLYLIAMAPQAPQYAEPAPQQQQQHHEQQQQQQPIYVPEQEPPTAPEAHPADQHDHHDHHDHELPITENNPRATHTKVIFNGQSNGADYAANMYVLPSHRPYVEEHPHHHQHHHHSQQQQVESAHVDVEAPAADYQAGSEEAMGITQPPYNYHAHGLKMPHHQVRQGKRAAKAEHQADSQLQQIREYVREKLGAEMGSAVEYKTTQLLEG
ncbi:uncharacterized protein LOC133848821 [Drosophila sulfurigaster albostrigata]|uniref:uncharacterized protein LOC133848821 n=1 Tax=Drosophila sulfurigaster albostrigata TaxID=89887 RepID=UPI002D21B070|nr:uncharacterized protein LOC133848821 [Drosophila sulfurigaster albostrigata]